MVVDCSRVRPISLVQYYGIYTSSCPAHSVEPYNGIALGQPRGRIIYFKYYDYEVSIPIGANEKVGKMNDLHHFHINDRGGV